VNGELGMKTGTLPSGIHVLAKPAGAPCTLACAHSFFLDKELGIVLTA
jgi:hypothetical protein